MAAVKLFEGIPPIVANVTRVKRDSNVVNATAKPIELFVEVSTWYQINCMKSNIQGGIMEVRPGNGVLKLEKQADTVTSMSSVPGGLRLRQPEFDPVDDKVRKCLIVRQKHIRFKICSDIVITI